MVLASSGNPSNLVMLTVLGIGPQRRRYSFGNEFSDDVPFSSIALLDVLPENERPQKLMAICTSKARVNSFDLFEQEVTKRGSQAEMWPIEGDGDEVDPKTYLQKLSKLLSSCYDSNSNLELLIDVTHGPRDFAFLTLIATQYFSEIKGVRIVGAYYGGYLSQVESTSRFRNLSPLLNLSEWIHALRIFGEAGDARSLLDLLSGSGKKEQFYSCIDEFSQARIAGLPLELGHVLTRLKDHEKRFKKAVGKSVHIFKDDLWNRLIKDTEVFLEPQLSAKGDWKQNLLLSSGELKRQTLLIDDLIAHKNMANVLGLMGEWVGFSAVFARGESDAWLTRSEQGEKKEAPRARAERRLNSLSKNKEEGLRSYLDDDAREVIDFWESLTQARNAFAHHGMRREALFGAGKPKFRGLLSSILEKWDEIKFLNANDSLFVTGDTCLLISPVGKMSGVIFSSVISCRQKRDGKDADKILLIASKETKGEIQAALDAAEFKGQVLEPIELQDAFAGFEELGDVVKTAKKHLVESDEAYVNVTGGTTFMGLCAGRLADEARLLDRRVEKFALIDKRSKEDQESDPFVASQCYYLG